jgi:hypothetical protein
MGKAGTSICIRTSGNCSLRSKSPDTLRYSTFTSANVVVVVDVERATGRIASEQ